MPDSEGSKRSGWRSTWNSEPFDSKRSAARFNTVLRAMAVMTVSVFAALSVLIVTNSVSSRRLSTWTLSLITASTFLILGTGVSLALVTSRRGSPTSIRIAILGLPQVGKTTLITTCFYEVFARRIGIRPVMSGTRAVERLNENISLLSSGRSLRATQDQDVYAYRFEVLPSRSLAPRYRVEIGDFPGEDTEKYAKEYGPWLHGTPFFEWALTCDSFAFCIDSSPLADLFKTKLKTSKHVSYIANSSATVRAAWQSLLTSFDSQRASYLRNSPALLVFTKVDLMYRNQYMENRDGPEAENETPQLVAFPSNEARIIEEWLQKEYSDLIDYMKGEARHFEVVATSAFATSGESRVGISEFLHGVLPSAAFSSASVSFQGSRI